MGKARTVLAVFSVAAVAGGVVLAYLWPSAPLLAYWLAAALGLGLFISFWTSLGDLQRCAKYLVWLFAVVVLFSLITTHIAARRAISSTHLVFRGVHLAGVDSFTIGSFRTAADVRLAAVTPGELPWRIRVRQLESGLELVSEYGVEQLRTRTGTDDPIRRTFNVAGSVVSKTDDQVTILAPDGSVADTLTVFDDRLQGANGATFGLSSRDSLLLPRYQRRLYRGTTLASLEGRRDLRTAAYERFVRVQELSAAHVVNGSALNVMQQWLGVAKRYLISAAPPYSVRSSNTGSVPLVLNEPSFVEVRNGSLSWQFSLLPDWRRERSAPRGVSLIFHRNPRPLDTPLPIGVTCETGAACGAISLRRLPPPIPHIALDHAGFDPDRFGLVGMVRLAREGYEVVLSDKPYYVEREGGRPVAIPVRPLSAGADTQRDSHWLLLEAAGDRDNAVGIIILGVGLALLFFAMQALISLSVPRRASAPAGLQGRAILVGLTVVLSLILARLMVGARVASFDPFLDRGIDTAVGLCTAVGVVVAALLSWSRWLPPFLAGADGVLNRGIRLSTAFRTASTGKGPSDRTAVMGTAACGTLALVLLTFQTGSAPWIGLSFGGLVILAWVWVAWIAAFTGHRFETFERGAHSLMEQSSAPGSMEKQSAFSLRASEITLLLGFAVLTTPHLHPLLGLGFSVLMILGIIGFALLRRRTGPQRARRNYGAAAGAVVALTVLLVLLRMQSENGSSGALILVIVAALVSVRIGRAVGARLESETRNREASNFAGWVFDAVLLTTPLLALIPLALIDMGLALVMVLPLGFATLMAAGMRNAGVRLVIPGFVLILLTGLIVKVLFPSMGPLREAEDHRDQAAAFSRMASIAGVRFPFLERPMDRAAARAVATHDRAIAESLVVAAHPGPARDLLIPSIEQIWGAKAYASSGMWGEGLGRAVVGGRGVAEAVAYAENTFAVFILAEHGALGGVLVLALYGLLTFAVATLAMSQAAITSSYRASRALFLIGALIITIPAYYVALSNLGMVPITGQNMPFLGLNGWSDVAICAGVLGILVTGALRAFAEGEA